MQNTISTKVYIYKNAIEACRFNMLPEYISSLTIDEVKELKYFVLSTNVKANQEILKEIYNYQMKYNSKKNYSRIYKEN